MNGSPAPRRRQPRGARSTRGDARLARRTPRPATNHSTGSATPWYRRWYSVIIGIGAIAGVVLTMSNLWAQFFPPNVEDVGTITSAHVTRQLYLSDFAHGGPADLRLEPASTTTSRGFVVHTQIRQVLAADAAAVTATPTDTTSAAGTSTPAGTVTPSGTGTPSGTVTSAIRPKWRPPSEAYLQAVDRQLVKEGYAPNVVYSISLDTSDPNDPGGDPLPPKEVAKRLAEALSKVEARNKGGKTDPLGWVVAVNVEAKGLKHVPLLLTWSLDGLDIPVRWAAENVAYRLTPTTDHDTGSVEVWVPDLKKQGKYNVNLTLALASRGTILTRGEPVEVPNK